MEVPLLVAYLSLIGSAIVVWYYDKEYKRIAWERLGAQQTDSDDSHLLHLVAVCVGLLIWNIFWIVYHMWIMDEYVAALVIAFELYIVFVMGGVYRTMRRSKMMEGVKETSVIKASAPVVV